MIARNRLFPLIALLGASLAAACGTKSEGSETAPTEAPPVLLGPENLFVAEQRKIQSGPVVSGTLDAERAATIRADLPSTVTQVLADAGQSVTRGQLLARLNDDALKDVVLSAKSGVRTAAEALAVAKRNAERAEKLAAAGAVADRELEQARWSVMNAEAGLADAEARRASAEKQLGYTEIRAPIAGVISERHVNTGDNVSAGNPLFSVVDPSSLRLEAQVPVSSVGSLKVGTPVPFAIDGFADRQFEGTVKRINPAVDPATRQVRITVALPNKTGRLVAGLFAQGRVAVEARDGLVVPASAVDRRGLRPAVTRIEGGVARRVEVALGIEDQAIDRVEITSGIAPGDTVVVGGARGIAPGTKVRPAATGERPASTTK